MKTEVEQRAMTRELCSKDTERALMRHVAYMATYDVIVDLAWIVRMTRSNFGSAMAQPDVGTVRIGLMVEYTQKRMMTENSVRFVVEAKAVTFECGAQERIVGSSVH